MAKPRIIIADTDNQYILPMQLRFVEEFFDQVDLEIITDADFFDNLFATPQKAEILIVSQELYDSSIHKHNIANIFLMTEQYEEDETDQLNLNKIFKYTSIKEIFNEIISKSSNTLKISSEIKKESQIILVYSSSGGVGKTTVALGMAACLTQNYKKVMYINAGWLQTFQHMFENQTSVSENDVYARLTNPSDDIYAEIKHVLRKELFTYLPPFKAALMSLGLKYSVYEKLALSAKKTNDFDFIIVDTDSEFDEEKASLLGVADKVVIVTKQNATSVYATNTLVSNMNCSQNDKYIFVCNDFSKDESNALISPTFTPKFVISEYIEHILHYDNLKVEEFASSIGMKKASFLVL